ncbi:tripartite tricarboxylate transporter TctB family protein [Roseomonas sp. AR75]|uniref:tripartite tricarboxylate transporter TctB family protein n=1 Tax=Roseomonas sp. AR75 TaxID=2562311 RepID=UPI0010BFA3EB|nr:tripartite tricarboxylate transporter TctB family protein [Roseomonas sp. AR75]
MQRQGSDPPPVGQELIIPVLAVGFTAYYFWTVQELAWEAKANGIVIGAILLVLVALLVFRLAWRVRRGQARLGVTLGGDAPTNRMRIALMAVMVGFLVALPLVGTSIALAVMLFASMWLLGERNWPTLIGVSVVTPLVVWATLIVILGTRFPLGPFEHAMAALFGLGPVD